MNLTEIKNATRIELLLFLEEAGYDVYPDDSTQALRNDAKALYWQDNPSDGFGFESIEGAY
jgi:hypothetical protein